MFKTTLVTALSICRNRRLESSAPTGQSMKPLHEQQAALVSFQPFVGKKPALMHLVICASLMELLASPGEPQAKQHFHHLAKSFLFPQGFGCRNQLLALSDVQT